MRVYAGREVAFNGKNWIAILRFARFIGSATEMRSAALTGWKLRRQFNSCLDLASGQVSGVVARTPREMLSVARRSDQPRAER